MVSFESFSTPRLGGPSVCIKSDVEKIVSFECLETGAKSKFNSLLSRLEQSSSISLAKSS